MAVCGVMHGLTGVVGVCVVLLLSSSIRFLPSLFFVIFCVASDKKWLLHFQAGSASIKLDSVVRGLCFGGYDTLLF